MMSTDEFSRVITLEDVPDHTPCIVSLQGKSDRMIRKRVHRAVYYQLADGTWVFQQATVASRWHVHSRLDGKPFSEAQTTYSTKMDIPEGREVVDKTGARAFRYGQILIDSEGQRPVIMLEFPVTATGCEVQMNWKSIE